MSLIFMSKAAIVLSLFLILNYIYKKVDWNSSDDANWDNIYLFKLDRFFQKNFSNSLKDILWRIWSIISIIPLTMAGLMIPYLIIDKCYEFVSEKDFIEQIGYIYGLLLLFFIFRVYFDIKKEKRAEIGRIIIEMDKKIYALEKELKELKNS